MSGVQVIVVVVIVGGGCRCLRSMRSDGAAQTVNQQLLVADLVLQMSQSVLVQRLTRHLANQYNTCRIKWTENAIIPNTRKREKLAFERYWRRFSLHLLWYHWRKIVNKMLVVSVMRYNKALPNCYNFIKIGVHYVVLLIDRFPNYSQAYKQNHRYR